MRLTLIRGLPGSGKSTMAKKIGCFFVEADMFHMKEGEYKFDQSKAKDAHSWCQKSAFVAMKSGLDVVVSNTFTQAWEMQPYIDMAKETGHEVSIVVASGNYGSVHNVPIDVIDRMKSRWESVDGEVFA